MGEIDYGEEVVYGHVGEIDDEEEGMCSPVGEIDYGEEGGDRRAQGLGSYYLFERPIFSFSNDRIWMISAGNQHY